MKQQRIAVIGALLTVAWGSGWVSAEMDQPARRSGQAIYEEFCFRCHGPKGEGDGPDAERLPTKPANFQAAASRAKTEFELLTAISYGIPFSPMHGWRGKISDEEVLEALTYIRQIAPSLPGR